MTFEFRWRAFLISQDRKYRQFLTNIGQAIPGDVDNVSLGVEDEDLSTELYYLLALAMPTDTVAETMVRNQDEGE